ncbi:protein GET1-like isoform X2 [Nicotiana sylvestris]|uniref:Protein GET1-like isoform X2 n=1 Tax=Nicotiana sylvestris TaxID=4096 RepID=A0A1U7VYR4_NICSY|nr:PREDICTED: protein GET1-like isoform X2 [Nicotiana sylvestris]
MEESMVKLEGSVAAPMIFFIVVAVQYLSRYVEINMSRVSVNAGELQLRAEIKQLLKEANAMSQPSTFAQAAKLRRMAAAKEQELVKNHEKLRKEMKSSYDSHTKTLIILKFLMYLLLIIWFWRIPVASIPKQLVQPFGKILSWRAGGHMNENVMVGIIPWLIFSTRVSKLICRKIFK